MAAAAGPALAAGADKPTVAIPRVTEPPVLSRYLDGTTTPPGVRISGLVQREPGDGVPASVETTAFLSYDDGHLYAVFVCKDDPAKVRANMTKREAIMGDDLVAVLLDTYHDGRRAYEFIVNPLGIQLDGVTTEGQDDDFSYDTLWQSDGRLTADGYVVLLKIPFKSLRFSNASEQTWGVAVGRIVPRNNETSFWPYITRRIAGLGQQMATLEGLQGISPGRNIQVIPYGNFAAAKVLDEQGVRVPENAARAGVDGKAVIKDALTVDMTVNPDFSQIESDQPQVTVNQRFEVFFPEKRPFFIENAGYFETPQNLFFSRRVADPGVGVRLTGKARGWAFGVLGVNDQEPGREVESGDPRSGKLAGVGVFRAQREFARQSYIGGIFTDRELGPAANRVYGGDARWKFTDNWTVSGQWVGSQTIDEAGDSASGTSWIAEVSREGRGFDYTGSYTSRSPDFRSELGYIRRVDMREVQQEADYSWYPEKRRILRVGADVEAGALWDYGGQLQDWQLEPGVEIELPGQTEIGALYVEAFERYEGTDFRRGGGMVRASTEWLTWLGANVHYFRGSGINYFPAEGLDPFLGTEQSVEAGLTLRPFSRLRLDLSYLYSDLSTSGESALPPGAPRGRIFTDHILRTRVNYQFTRELSARIIFDYESLSSNQALVDLEHERRFNADILFTYLVNPWTAVYVGYTDGYENRPLAPLTSPPPSPAELPLISTGRQVFVKLSYLFRF
ncbi:MAG: carbohydrate binding family 9 domain-containing protein [Vicinamibacterales bacterium]|jgi:hypothetical protein|nr:carbohydrate binding family 9 domain-containing protein [Vicinamibacterales bacterium]